MFKLKNCSKMRAVFGSILWLVGGLLAERFAAGSATNEMDLPRRGLTLSEVVDRVLTYNEDLQIKMIEVEVSRR